MRDDVQKHLNYHESCKDHSVWRVRRWQNWGPQKDENVHATLHDTLHQADPQNGPVVPDELSTLFVRFPQLSVWIAKVFCPGQSDNQ